MTQVLLSVRSEEEARLAARFSIGILDIKEPGQGALGPASPETCRDILAFLPTDLRASVAMGELTDWVTGDSSERPFESCERSKPSSGNSQSRNPDFAKIGLSRQAGHSDWGEKWKRWASQLPVETRPVAVVYADQFASRCPRADEVIEVTSNLGCQTILVDTFVKRGGDLMDHWSLADVRGFLDRASRNGFTTVLAGSIKTSQLQDLLHLQPDFIGIRGAACRDHRQHLDADRLQQFMETFSIADDRFRSQ